MSKKLTDHQQSVMDTLRNKSDAFIKGSGTQWFLFYSEGGLRPGQKLTKTTVGLLFERGYITLRDVTPQGVVTYLPTTIPT